jgi:hypothetical protein
MMTLKGTENLFAKKGDRELADLQAACDSLDAVIGRIGESDAPWRAKGGQSMGGGPRKPVGPREISCTHEAIYNHSQSQPHAKWVWITWSSTVDKAGNLGDPASAEEVCRFGTRARKVFLWPSPSTLQKSFAEAVKMYNPDRPWKRRVADERDHAQERSVEDHDLRAKRQHGMGAMGGAGRIWGRDDRGGHRGRDATTGHRGEDTRGTEGQLDPPRQGGGGIIEAGTKMGQTRTGDAR